VRASQWLAAACTVVIVLTLSAPIGRTVEAGARDLRVMSFNIRYGTAADGRHSWEDRRGLVLEVIKEFDPDVLGTQECLKFQADFLEEHLTEYGLVGAGRDDGADAGEMCAVLYRADRFEKLDHGHFWLSETPDSVGSRGWDAALPRMATWVKLRAKGDTLGAFLVVNTHFDHAGPEARFESARLLCARTHALRDGLPAIVMGDFNSPADSTAGRPYVELLTGVGDSARALVDAYRATHPVPEPNEGTFNAFRGLIDGARIDWILVTPDIEVLEGDIERRHERWRYPSDHFPVSAVLKLPSGPRG
jgi:endonuclease/exonuclease/phosphatase family metal-dependent hydrolase